MDAGGEDFQSLPVTDRLQHKLWKARVSAYEELTSLFRKTDNDSDFYTYESYLKKIATDANAVAQESGLNVIYEFVNNAPNASSTRETVVPAIVEKCLGATKAGTKQKAIDILLLYAEIDVADPVVELVIPGINAKQPKLVTQTVIVLKEFVKQYGIKTVNPKSLLKIIPKLFGHTDKNVRAETFALTVELYRWLGAAINGYLSDLKPVQQKDLEEAFSKLPNEKATPERLLRCEQAAAAEAAAANEADMDEEVDGEDDGGEAMDDEPIDPYDLADPVDITSKLPGNFFELLASKKWQERREALDALVKVVDTPKLADSDYTELMGALAKRISDTNILLVGTAANCIERIATGLRQDFGKYKGVVALPMIEKLKERKPAILEQLLNGLNAVFASVPLNEIIEDITTAVKHKNPQVRANSVKLLSRRLKETRIAPIKSEYKAFAELMLKTLDDADAGAREASAEGLGTLMKVIGEKALLPWTEGLDDIKTGKIKEACEKAEVKAKPVVAKKPPPVKKAPAAKAPVKKVAPKPKPKPEPMAIDDESAAAPPVSPPKRKPPARLAGASSAKKPTLSSSKPKAKPAAAASSGPKKAGAAKLPPSSGPEEVRYRFSADDAEARTTEFVPEAIWNDLQQSQWKLRLAAMESLYSHFDQMEEPIDTEPEIVFRVFSKKPGWKEMNFQVMGKLFATMQLLAEKCPNFSKACVAIAVQVLVEKLGDIKLKKPAGECLVVFAEKTSLQFVFSQSYPIWKKAKSPKVLADSLTWVHTAVMEFGIAGLQVRDLIEFLKFALSNTNASVRTSAVKVLGALRLYIGPEIKSFVQDVTPALMANIEAEFDKVAQMDPPQPTRTTAESQAASGSGGGGGGGSGNAAADAVESLFPRVDISSSLSKASNECNDANWKIRKEGLEKVLGIIEGANKRIKPNLGEFPGVLKQRLNDSNKNLQIMALEIAGLLAESSGKPFEKYIKLLTGPVTGSLSDNKTNVRAAGVAALEQFRKVCGLEGMIGSFATSLAADSPMLRKELLAWLATHLKEDPNAATYDLVSIIAPMLSCLQDRNGDVRKSAQACLPMVIASAGYDAVVHKAADLKGAQRQAIMPLIEANRGAASAAAVTSTSPAAAAPPSTPAKRVAAAKSTTEDSAKPASVGRGRVLTKRKPGLQPPRASGIASSSGASSASATASSAADSVQAPVLTSDARAKQTRAKKEIRWQFDTPRPDIMDGLRTAFEPNVSSEVCSLLFSTSQYAERDRLSGLTQLNECLAKPEVSSDKYDVDFSDMKQRFIVNADLIFKYLTIRFFDTNTSMLIKCLDITQNLVAVMDEEGYHLTEYEAVSFLPFLINKVGDPKEVMRTRIRNILKSFCRIYPASKLFNYLLDSAATSKNAKARAECLEEVGALIQRNGISVMLPNKSLPLIATHIGDRDAGVRNAALNAIAQAYILTGDAVFKHVSRLGEKEKGMLEERLKRTKPSASVLAEKEAREKQEAEEMEIDEFPTVSQLPRLPRASHGKQRSIAPPSSMPSPQQYQQRQHQQHQQQYDPEPMEDVTDDYGNQFNETGGMAGISEPRSLPGPSSMRQPRSATHQAFQKAVQQDRSDYIVDYLISQITSGDPQPSIEALKQLDKLLNSKPELILPDIEQLINAITLQVRLAYSNVDPRVPAMTRLCKHLVNALVLLFSNRDLACAVSQEALHHLLEELAHRLLDQKMLAMESGPQLSKALNVAMVKVLENSNRNATFSALLSILGSCAAGLHPGDNTSAKETRYTELTMKCLWKLAKTVQENLRARVLNPDELLYEINRFFITTPPAEWKRRAAENVPLGEMPLRTVKTLLLELVNGLGDSIFQHLTLIENPPASSVYPYLHHMLEACRKRERMQQARLQQQQQQQQPPTPQSPVAPTLQQQHSLENHYQQQQQRFSMNSLNSSLSRPSSMSSLQSNSMLRSTSIASYPSSGEGDAPTSLDTTIPVATPMRNNISINNINNNNTNVQPMQVDEQADPNKPISDYEMNNLLTQIFVKIGTREQTKQGIVELYEFQKKYPLAEAKVNTYLSQSGTYFQSYIRRGLSNLAAEDNELQLNSSPTNQLQQSTPSSAITPTNATTTTLPPSSTSPPLANTTATTTPPPPPLSSTGEYGSHHSSPRNSSSPQISSPVPQEQKQSFDLHRTSSMSNPRASMHADDASEIKQRLQRLKQKFGGKTSQQQQQQHY